MQITNTAEFATALDATIAEVDALVVAEPDYPVWRQLQQQLHAMSDWSMATTAPTADKLAAVSIGLIAARELEPTDQAWLQDLIDRLHLLNHYWRHWPSGDASRHLPPTNKTWNGARNVAIAVAVLACVVLASLVAFRSVARTQAGPAMPFGKSMAIPGAMATLTTSLEPYTVSLHHDPTIERQEIRLQLSDPTHQHPDRMIQIARHMRANGLQFNARLLGDDGHRLWFFVEGIGAWDYRQDKLVDADDLRRANPALGTFKSKDNRGDPLIDPSVARIDRPARDLWSGESRLYGFNGRLQVTTPDFQGIYDIDPETLQARSR